MHIAAVHTTLPDHRYEQAELAAAFVAHWAKKHHNVERVQRFHEAVQVGARHLALPIERYPELSFGEANRAFVEVGTTLGARVIAGALDQVGLSPTSVDAIFFTTVTGIATPTIDARVANRLGFRPDIRRTPMFGLGCVAGAAGIGRVNDYLTAYPHQVAVLLSVELCSLTLQRGDLSIANLIATSLFGDGAAAVVCVGDDHPLAATAAGPRVSANQSRFYPNTERVMGWEITDNGMQIVLSANVPQVVRDHLRADVDGFLARQGRTVADIGCWVCHPGGPKVLEAFADCLSIGKKALQRTWDSLDAVGNLSSASVLFVLQDTIVNEPPAAGTSGLMIAMGPGFCSELVSLEW